jgi:hypothetical protein
MRNGNSALINGGLSTRAIVRTRFPMARLPDGTSGQVLTAQGAGVDPVYAAAEDARIKIIRKAADEIVNNSSTLQNDDDLYFAIAANEVWQFRFVISILSGTTPDFQMAITVPTGATIAAGAVFVNTAGALIHGNYLASGTAWDIQTNGVLAGDEVVFEIEGYVSNDVTAGNVQLQWAQYLADASDTTVKAGSYLIAHKLS